MTGKMGTAKKKTIAAGLLQGLKEAHSHSKGKLKLSETLRGELKEYLDLAAKEPVRIQRRTGESIILLNESAFAALQNEIVSLQRRLLGMSDFVSGKTTEHKIGDRSRLNRIKKRT